MFKLYIFEDRDYLVCKGEFLTRLMLSDHVKKERLDYRDYVVKRPNGEWER